jgi:Glycosyltransferase family 87
MKALRLQKEQIWFFCAIIFLLLGLAYIIKGFYHLTIDRQGAIDLLYRWKEQQYIYRGLYPYDIREGSLKIDPQIGAIESGGYPPWAFFTGFFFVPGFSLELTRFYFAILNAIALVIVAIFSYQIGIPYGRSQALFAMSASLAFGSNGTTLLNGQYGIIINAFLIAMFWSFQKHKNIWMGIWLAIAMVKPNISAFYFLILLVHRRTKALLSFFIYIIGASAIIWIVTKTDPIYMSNAILIQSRYFADEGYSSINFLTNIGIDPKIATIVLALVGAIAIAGMFYVCRDRSLLTLFAIASVIGRVATYHRFYDNVMLVFFWLALVEIAFRSPRAINLLMIALVGMTLWLPGRIVEIPGIGSVVESIQIVVWIVALVYLLMQNKIGIQKSKDASDRVFVP